MKFLLHPEKLTASDEVGGKARALAVLTQGGLPVPPWCVIRPEAFEASGAAAATRDPRQPAPAVREEISQALAVLCPQGELVAVRSSAVEEDAVETSFAGQLESFLAVRPDDVADKVALVWRSAFSERVLHYRRQRGLTAAPRAPAVIVQRMLDPAAAGVAFSADPVTGRRGVAVVSALYGLATALVSGRSHADTWRVDRDGTIIQREMVPKRISERFDPDAGEIRSHPVPEVKAILPTLDDAQVRAVAKLARRAAKRFGRPQDIEWALEKDQIYLLQSRPITALSPMPDPDGRLNIWDNSNIVESYGGVTAPLTFSFIRRAYEEVYRQFCRLMAVPAATLHQNEETFQQMLGLIRGRVYYNLLNWYRVLAMLPGFKFNRRFMEQMMGVKEPLPQDVLQQLQAADWPDRVRDGFRLLRTIGGLLVNYFLLPRRIEHFYHRIEVALAPTQPALAEMRPDELTAYYRGLEQQLLRKWDAPIVNDFFAMLFFGLLRQLCQKWSGDIDGSLGNGLVRGEGGMISTEPARRVVELARIARDHPSFVTLLGEGSTPAIVARMEEIPRFRDLYREYLATFGHRGFSELKLESPTLRDDPLVLLRTVAQLARAPEPSPVPDRSNPAHPSQSEQDMARLLKGRPVRHVLFRWALVNARERVRDRENLRFERSRLFDRVRQLFLVLGDRLQEINVIGEARDVFYLEVNELLGFVEGTATTTDLAGLVAARKKEFARFAQSESPPNRFETRGTVDHWSPHHRVSNTPLAPSGDERRGLACSPGRVRGRVRIVTEPREAHIEPGDILVAPQTDPGWVLLFASAAGLLVERGSLLSHSAIVARELGLPAIVGLEGITQWLQEGQIVEMDGSTGVVRIVPP